MERGSYMILIPADEPVPDPVLGIVDVCVKSGGMTLNVSAVSLWLILSAACSLMLLGISGAAQTPSEKEIPEKNPFDSAADVAAGRQYFVGHCALCHGPEGEGGRGINLTAGRYRMGASDRELFRTIQKGVPESEMPGTSLSENEIWRIVAFVRRLATAGADEKAPGDPAAGKLAYEGKGLCASCHVVGDGGGGRLGPELSEVGLRRSLKFLRESITNPGAYIADDFRTVTVLTRTDEPITAIKLNEDDYSIQVRDVRENLRSFLKSDLKEVKRETRSLMPAYGSTLSPAEIENVVAYLSSLRGKK